MDKQQFLEWHREKYNPADTYAPGDISEWYDLVVKRHEDLVSTTFGGKDTVVVQASVAKSEDPLPTAILTDIYDKLYGLIPGYFTAYNFDRSTLGHPHIPSSVSKFGGKSVTWHIGGYVKRLGSKIDDEKTKAVCAVLSKLAALHKQYCIEHAVTRTIIFSCHPAAFTRIGNCGCDKGSCFGKGQMNRDKVFAIGVKTGSFVALMPHRDHRVEDTITIEKLLDLKVIARMVCFKLGRNSFTLCNRYGDAGEITQQAVATQALRQLACSTTKWTHKNESQSKWTGGINYHGSVDLVYEVGTNPAAVPVMVFSTKYSKEHNKGQRDIYADYGVAEPTD